MSLNNAGIDVGGKHCISRVLFDYTNAMFMSCLDCCYVNAINHKWNVQCKHENVHRTIKHL